MSRKALTILIQIVLLAVGLFLIGGQAMNSLKLVNKVTDQESAYQQKMAEVKAHMHDTEKVVYATREVNAGEIIAPDAVEERDMEVQRVPLGSINAASMVIGRTTRYSLQKDQIVSQYDLSAKQR